MYNVQVEYIAIQIEADIKDKIIGFLKQYEFPYIKSLKDKIEHSTSYLMLIGEGVKKLVEVARDYAGKTKPKRKKTTKK